MSLNGWSIGLIAVGVAVIVNVKNPQSLEQFIVLYLGIIALIISFILYAVDYKKRNTSKEKKKENKKFPYKNRREVKNKCSKNKK